MAPCDGNVGETSVVQTPADIATRGHVRLDVSKLTLPKCQLPPRDELEPVEIFVGEAVRQRNAENKDPKADTSYRAVMECIRKREDPNMLRLVLLALRTGGPTLHLLTSTSKRHEELLHCLLRLDPFHVRRSKAEEKDYRTLFDNYTIADAYLPLILAMLSSNSVFLTPVLTSLWRRLTFAGPHSEERTNRLHAALISVVKLCPRAIAELLPIVQSNFPYRVRPLEQIVWYTQQCLCLLDYAPSLRNKILELLIEQGLAIDVDIKINDGGDVTIERESKEEEDGIFEMDMDDTTTTTKTPQKTLPPATESVDEMADKLDCILLAVFEYISLLIDEDPSAARTLFDCLVPVFESSILTTYKSKFVQFVVFVVCGLDPSLGSLPVASSDQDQLYREFPVHLIKIVMDPYRAIITRQSAVCYLASFISRASYVCPETACETVAVLLRWTEKYMETWETSPTVVADARYQCNAHSLFYTVCQAAFYIMCFRGAESFQFYQSAEKFFETRHGDGDEQFDYPDLEQIDVSPRRWQRLCSHPLQPLRYCLESVREEFLHMAGILKLLPPKLQHSLESASQHQSTSEESPNKTSLAKTRRPRGSLISTPVTLEKRRRNGGVGGMGQGSNPLDSFFPFDPFLLRRSHRFIDNMYRNWEGNSVVDTVDDEETTDRNDDCDASESEADDDQDMTVASSMAMSLASTAATSPPTSVSTKDQQEDTWNSVIRRNRAASIESGSW